ncbi:hypothetical protein RDWZM_000506 [Blomia tropicalis]|uniref:B30.2/SPRY domain-containing protein n=1 Tax=Blomia tropicalis TaxID=40697 RepID=A0A9Q0RPP8_BLOTA|nr:hypothetical protein RDWZM_000506 [Blomia tropicalis]
MITDVHMETFNESSNEVSNQIKREYFSEESNMISGEITKYELNDDNSLSNLINTSEVYVHPVEVKTENGLSHKCYCGKDRDLEVVELQCLKCLRWCHEACITIKLEKVIRFSSSYTFICKLCSHNQIESYTRRQPNFTQICQTALANLVQIDRMKGVENIGYSKDKQILPFIDKNWEYLTTQQRRINYRWHNTVLKTMMNNGDIFLCDNRSEDILFGLRDREFHKIAPNYDKIKNHALLYNDGQNSYGNGALGHTPGAYRSARGVKRKFGMSNNEAMGDLSQLKNRQKSELTQPKLPPSGFPIEFPYNKDSYRYFLAEPDIHAPGKKEYEDSQDYGAGKPIPNWLFRKLLPEKVALSLHDRAPQLKVSDDRKSVSGEKGYSMIRANSGVTRGIWYYELKITDMPGNSATRIGWSQELANLQTPLGYDKFGYSWRSRKGTKFHESIGRHFADVGFGVGDVIGCLIDLPHELDENDLTVGKYPYRPFLPKTHKEKPLIKFKSFHYFEEKDEVQKSLKELTPLPGSKIVYYKNGIKIGTAFTDIYKGVYYPSAGLYKNISVTFNFGPEFEHPPSDPEYGSRYRAMNDIIFVNQVEQSLSDMIYLVENESNLNLEKFYDGYNKAS